MTVERFFLRPEPRLTRPRWFALRDLRVLVVASSVVVLGAAGISVVGPIVPAVAGAAVVFGLFALVAARPVAAAYVFVATLPFLGGIDRGHLIPLLRPNEALQFALTAAVLAGACVRATRGEAMTLRMTRLDRAIVVLALLASIWPIFWMLARGLVPSASDLSSTVVVWRLASLYALFRWVVRTPDQLRRCLWIIVGGACVLSVLAVVQSLGFLHIGGLWTPTVTGDTTGRGSATLNSSIAVGDYVAYTLAIVLVWYLRGQGPRALLRLIAGVLVLGALGTGQFSAWIAALIVVGIVVHDEGQFARLARWFAPLAVLGAVVAGPVLATRLSGFGGDHAVPSSWLGRVDNLTHFYLPQLAGFHWVLGVRPDSVLPAPETWRDAIFLESGVLWCFWVGGIPLFVGFVWFVVTAFRHATRVARARADDIGVAALAARAALCSMAVLSLIDMHLTLRGGGDLLFVLLGLSANLLVPVAPVTRPAPERSLA